MVDLTRVNLVRVQEPPMDKSPSMLDCHKHSWYICYELYFFTIYCMPMYWNIVNLCLSQGLCIIIRNRIHCSSEHSRLIWQDIIVHISHHLGNFKIPILMMFRWSRRRVSSFDSFNYVRYEWYMLYYVIKFNRFLYRQGYWNVRISNQAKFSWARHYGCLHPGWAIHMSKACGIFNPNPNR